MENTKPTKANQIYYIGALRMRMINHNESAKEAYDYLMKYWDSSLKKNELKQTIELLKSES